MLHFDKPHDLEPYLQDASRFRGEAEKVFLPEGEKEISELLQEANARKIPITVSGGKTGLVGAAVPQGGWVLSTEKLSRLLDLRKAPPGQPAWVCAEPACLLQAIHQAAEREGLFYPPDPTGKKAFLGGTLATNASGPNSFKYGATRRFVRRIRLVLATGETLDLGRGEMFADRTGLLEVPLDKRKLKILIPHYWMPRVKHAGGYFAEPGMDAIDLFIGSEGTLGVVTEIELTLLPKPDQVLSFLVFFRKEEDVWRFVKEARGKSEPRALEYFDRSSLEFLRPLYPSIPREAEASLLIEQETRPETKATLLHQWEGRFEKGKALREVWVGETLEKQNEFRQFRSDLPVAVNEFIKKHGQMKLSTDTAVPHEQFEALMLFHRERVEASGLPSVTFGHIGESHVHLNLLPRNEEEARKAHLLYRELVKRAMDLGGTFSGEHGVGKLKRAYLHELFGEKAIEEMKALKRAFDPNEILGRGNLFEIK